MCGIETAELAALLHWQGRIAPLLVLFREASAQEATRTTTI